MHCTSQTSASTSLGDPSNEFHEHLVLFHTPQSIYIYHIVWIHAPTVGRSSFKPGNPSNKSHEHLVLFHTPQFISLGWISSYNRMIIISLGIFTYTILDGFILLWLENNTLVYPLMKDISYCPSINFNLIHPLTISYLSIWNEFHDISEWNLSITTYQSARKWAKMLLVKHRIVIFTT